MDGLCFANALVRTRDEKSLIVTEPVGHRLLRPQLAGHDPGTFDISRSFPGGAPESALRLKA
jgi:hypothetical protein